MVRSSEWADIGERVRRGRLAMGLSQAELGAAVGLDRTMIAKVEGGSRRVDALELTRLAATLKLPVDDLLHAPPPVLSRRTAVADQVDTDVDRDALRLDSALVAWLRDLRQLVDVGTLEARPLLTYPGQVTSPADAREAARWIRHTLGYGQEPIDSLMSLCERAGQFLLVTELVGDGASAVDGDIAAAVVSLRGDPGRRRTTTAHELGHLVLGDEYSTDLGVSASRSEREAAVDAFAAELLLPSRVIVSHSLGGLVVRDTLVHLAARYRTSWSLAISQAALAGLLTAGQRRELSRVAPTRVEFLDSLGWAPQPDLDSIRVPPSYAHSVIEAWRRGFVTRSRAVELMHGQIAEADLPRDDEADIAP